MRFRVSKSGLLQFNILVAVCFLQYNVLEILVFVH